MPVKIFTRQHKGREKPFIFGNYLQTGCTHLRNSTMKSFNAAFTFFLPRLRDMLFIVIFVGALMLGPRMINGDLGRHLTLGKYMVTTLNIPVRDLFSFTRPNQPRPPYEWLAQVIFYIVYRILNLDGVVLLTALILAMAFLVVYIDSVRRSGLPIIALFLTVWATASSSLDWLTRPHVFSFLFFAIWILWLEKIRNGKKAALWWFPALMLVWANTHGGFIFGILAWVAYFAGWLWEYRRKSADIKAGRTLMIVGGLSLITTILTPDLWRNWQGVLANNSVYILSHTSETMPPDFAVPGTFPFTVLLGSALILLLLGWKRIPISHILLLLGLALISLIMARNIPFFAIATAPIISGYIGLNFSSTSMWLKLEQRVAKIDGSMRGYGWPILTLLVTIGFFSFYQTRTQTSVNQFSSQTFPVQAADWIENHPPTGNMFNDFNWGGYLLFRLWPGTQVFIDSQSDFYGEGLTRQYAGIIAGQGNWDSELSRHNVNWIIVPSRSGLAAAASANSNWQTAYEDSLAVIFVRK